MKNLNRRELCVALSALAAMSGEVSPANAQGMAADPGDKDLGGSHVIAYDQLPVHKNANGGESRAVMSGVVKTGEYLEIHETMLPAGQMPHPPHKHPNTEVLFIQTGNVEYINDGKPEPVGPGGIIFTASNVMHGLKNVGTTPATYIVVSIGRQLKQG
jgi:quercetin dioxygenase-like cupin family protein